MKKKTLMIILSDICVAECRICSGLCSPRNKNVIDEGLMRSIINQAKWVFEIIEFNGGEPFLQYDLLKKGLNYAKELGFKTTVFTNGFWGSWTDMEMFEKIGTLPIDTITISTDSYHEQFVPEPDVGRAALFAKAAKMGLFFRIGETNSGEPATLYFQRMGAYKFLTNVTFYPFAKAGRAKTLPDGDFCRFVRTEDIMCTSNDTISVRYDGEVFPCAELAAHDAMFAIGNINECSLSDIITENSAFLSLLREPCGLRKLAAMAREELDMEMPELCVSGCEICYSILKDKDIRGKVMRRLERCAL